MWFERFLRSYQLVFVVIVWFWDLGELMQLHSSLVWLLGLVIGFSIDGISHGQQSDPFPSPGSIKGLQVQMVDDAIALGVRHAALNLPMGGMIANEGDADAIQWKSSDVAYRFNRRFIEGMDRRIKPLSDAGVVVYLILLAMPTGDANKDAILLHPRAGNNGPYTISAFNVHSPAGQAWFRAAMEFLADRYSSEDPSSGRVWGWIVGNEVNSHSVWHNCGASTLDELVDGYEKSMRIVHESVRRSSRHGRVYVSLDHHWTSSHTPQKTKDSVPGRDLLDRFAKTVREKGEFDWHIAYHPYHSNLFSSEVWNDTAVTKSVDTPKITFANLEILCRYLDRDELKYKDATGEMRTRRVILSEQGFHSEANEQGELKQASAYVYAWEKCKRLESIDAFIYHRHVDHAREGGLRLGLWRNVAGSIDTPLSKKPIYEVFLKAGTKDWDAVSREALGVTGLSNWDLLNE